jgi:hypothetical protein
MMEDERFKGVVVWVKQYKVNREYLEWLKENNPEWYKELTENKGGDKR